MADIGKSVKGDSVTVIITINERSTECVLNEVTENYNIKINDAVKIFYNNYKSQIDSYFKRGIGEFHVSMIYNVNFDKNLKLWYMEFIADKSNLVLCVNVNTGELTFGI